MAIPQLERNVSVDPSFEHAKVLFICPVCKAKKALDVPKPVITKAKQITTMSIARGLVCDHQFQAFVDKQFKVRGYQRVDFEFESQIIREKNYVSSNFEENDEEELFDNLILEGNFVEYKPNKKREEESHHKHKKHDKSSHKNRSLQDIYNEFKDFIDDENEFFKDFQTINSQEKKNDKNLNPRDIFNEFSEFIDKDNKTFQRFID